MFAVFEHALDERPLPSPHTVADAIVSKRRRK
jgi:hypothetical protein